MLGKVAIKNTSIDKVLEKLMTYCAYQERCKYDVLQKLNEWQVPTNEYENILHTLEQSGYIDDLRYAQTFARAKFKQLNWGKTKIQLLLKDKKISEKKIEVALAEINLDEYNKAIQKILEKKREEYLKKYNAPVAQQKIIQFLISKGFEYTSIKNVMNCYD